MSSTNIYFAKDDIRNLLERCEKEISTWNSNKNVNNLYTNVINTYRRNMASYYSPMITPDSTDSALGFTGAQDEIVKMTVPKARSLVRQFCSLLTRSRLQFEIITDVNESKPLESAKIGKALANSIVETQKLDDKIYQIAERTSVAGAYFAQVAWRSDKGYLFKRLSDEQGNLTENFEYSGDVLVSCVDLHDVIYNYAFESWDQVPWIIVRKPISRWDLVAQYPELADEIKAVANAKQDRQKTTNFEFSGGFEDPDTIQVKEFFHKPCPALPYGRMTVWVGDDVVLFDSPEENPYGCLPIVPFFFEKINNTCLGYSWFSNVLPLQEMLDHSYSAISSNQRAYAIQSMYNPRGSNISVSDMGGLRFIDYTVQDASGGGKPEPVTFPQTPQEVYNFLNLASQEMNSLANMSDTLRGEASANVTSGQMAATLSANALQFMDTASRTLQQGAEAIVNLCLKCYQKFATIDQIVEVVGEGNVGYAKEFQSSEIAGIKKLKIRTQNALASSVAGRMQMAEGILPMLQAGSTDAIKKYFQILDGAPVDNLYDVEQSESIAVQQEVDALLEGKNILPLITDNHPEFIKEYQKLLYNPAIRTNSPLTQHIIELMNVRLQLEMQCPPDLKAILRGTPPPPPGMATPPPPGGAPQEANPAPQGATPAEPAQPV